MPDLGHPHLGGVGDDADAAVRADPDTAAHHDAVHDRDVGLGVCGDIGVEDVLVVPERPRLGTVALGAVIDRDDVATCAQSAVAGAGKQYGVHGVVVRTSW